MKTLTEKIDAILDIKHEALYLHERLPGGEPAVYPESERQFEGLAARFYGRGSRRLDHPAAVSDGSG